MCDVYNEDIQSKDDENLHVVLPISANMATCSQSTMETWSWSETPLRAMIPNITEADIFSIIPTLCYCREAYVDFLEFCGGQGRISKVAFKRGLSFGGNLDVVTGCDLGESNVQ